MHVIPKKQVCTFSPQFGHNISCSVRAIEGMNGTFTSNFYFRRPVNNILVNFIIYEWNALSLPPNSHMYIWYEFSVFSLNWRLLVKWIRTTPAYMVWGICPSIFVNILKDLDGRISCIWLLITWKTIPICYIPVHFRCVWRSDMIILMLNNILWIFCRVIATWKTSHWICLGRFTMANIWFNYSFSRISANVKYSSPSLVYFMTLSIIRDFLTLNKITMCAGIW